MHNLMQIAISFDQETYTLPHPELFFFFLYGPLQMQEGYLLFYIYSSPDLRPPLFSCQTPPHSCEPTTTTPFRLPTADRRHPASPSLTTFFLTLHAQNPHGPPIPAQRLLLL